MPSSTVEDYAKAISLLQEESPTGEATVARLAATLGVTKGSVTAMVRKLRDAGLARAPRYGGITLTARGQRLATDVVRRHRLLEVFLVEKLGLDWAEVHDEAERLEHAVSAKVLDRLDAFLGYPSSDPHGDPIPGADGQTEPEGGVPLSSFDAGEKGVISRVADQAAEFLAFAADKGFRPGVRFTVVDRVEPAGSMTVRPSRRSPVMLSLDAASKVLAERR
ncbi:MAG: metal-dependent transcriptional regulator [Planctomycetota bacterium]